MTHIIEAHKRYARSRLVPTTITSLLSLTHFHLVTFHSFFVQSKPAVAPPVPTNTDVSSMFMTSSYPLPTLIPSLVETFLILIVLTTVALNALTQILTTGGIRGPLVGLIGHAETLAPRWDEDFGVVLFRLGTASVEATCVKGFGNEVGGIEMGSLPATRPALFRGNRSQFGRRLAIKAAEQERDGGLVELNRAGVVSVYNARTSVGAGGGRTKTTAIKKGLWNEIKHVKATIRREDLWADSLLNVPWYRGLGRFVVQLWALEKRAWDVVKGVILGRGVEGHRVRATTETSADRRSSSREVVWSADDQVDMYERFLRGEELGDEDDEEDGDYDPQGPAFEEFSASDVEDDELDDEDEQEEGVANDTLSLYTDLSQDPIASSSTSTVLLAHLTSPGALTRRQFSSLLQLAPQSPALDSETDWIMERRAAKAQYRSTSDDESRRMCVVCCAEERQIICWPCRCLALCDDCRENMASRAAASKHICPCCRRT